MGGRLIVFEGVEGSGKTTQLQRSHGWLLASGLLDLSGDFSNKTPVVVTREPGGTSLGVELRQLLLGETDSPLYNRTELLLYAADRAQHIEEFIKPQLAKGAIILCDRYTDSTIAYQGYGRGLDLALIEQLNQVATGGLESDLTLWLDVNAETGLKRARQRGAADRMEQAELAFHQRVEQGFAKLALSYPDRIVRIDASQDEDAVQLVIRDVLRQRFNPLPH
ncbi:MULTISPECIES: dTMP kinase [unclassified Coleofasciculus]|uniref:dTMP kinase n=1 Tax=unclassified Coleofasciculus TaxID=2692782 RepID=UPI00188034AB|nr:MULTISPECIES: dTMP kinase [unclassified Coleofasciculus]MBE9127907.1 dTMP kinase [Coleofasciculus sp. LEGE 07081]MBE9148072.1 dTMP kinase [Coleofasciculus sp. LEGE 07092]